MEPNRAEFVEALTREERLVLMLYFAEDLSEPEIAAVLGTPVERVRAIRARLVERARAALAETKRRRAK